MFLCLACRRERLDADFLSSCFRSAITGNVSSPRTFTTPSLSVAPCSMLAPRRRRTAVRMRRRASTPRPSSPRRQRRRPCSGWRVEWVARDDEDACNVMALGCCDSSEVDADLALPSGRGGERKGRPALAEQRIACGHPEPDGPSRDCCRWVKGKGFAKKLVEGGEPLGSALPVHVKGGSDLARSLSLLPYPYIHYQLYNVTTTF